MIIFSYSNEEVVEEENLLHSGTSGFYYLMNYPYHIPCKLELDLSVLAENREEATEASKPSLPKAKKKQETSK